jgi:hypothetical protein
MVLLGGVTQIIEHHARFHPSGFRLRIQLENPIEILREIDHHRDVATLTAQASAAPATQDGHVELTTHGDGRDDVFDCAWNYDADRYLTIVRSICGIGSSAAVVEANFRASRLS